ncbi:hypothetical protein BDV27DRAFT_133557 [Aspergillus caelatus]|uniref:Uncharacterized protein n=1 Tax=Aspergillus caelatus TaxID=61420 RepID=A0A5N6ZXP7_9EURO|nr:uncharacterized protein BDV27DRAFT_133557 [Aspergillus caelatus]KAE8361060.1 hypothetical protein BDV27DRAFT_133557 [Aspergillus caelatus]
MCIFDSWAEFMYPSRMSEPHLPFPSDSYNQHSNPSIKSCITTQTLANHFIL